MTYKIFDNIFDTIEEATDYIVETIDDSCYRNILDEVYGKVNIGGHEYYTGYALEKLDPTAYRCGFNDWVDGERDYIKNELARERAKKYMGLKLSIAKIFYSFRVV